MTIKIEQKEKILEKNRLEDLEECKLCAHLCKINRNEGQIGRCKAGNTIKIALYSVHNFEEPCISGKNGSGTVFFSNCNFSCIYCQNYEISQLGKGKEIEIERLAEIFLEQQKRKVENINLVTPTSYVPQIIEAIKIAKKRGLKLPIVYNTNSYEIVETIKMLEGYIDVYLPDLKYFENDLGKKYSNINNYFEIATEAIKEMVRQVGRPKLNERGILEKGVVIRHLVLPNNIENSKRVLKWIKNNLEDKVYVSIMAQYFPTYKAKNDSELNRKLTKEEWAEIEEYIEEIGIENGYIQELGEHEEEYVPKWDC